MADWQVHGAQIHTSRRLFVFYQMHFTKLKQQHKQASTLTRRSELLKRCELVSEQQQAEIAAELQEWTPLS